MCEVISENFLQLLPLICEQIDQSCFLAIDTEFSSIDFPSATIKTIEQIYQQRSNFVQQITILQFGLAIFSPTSNPHKYQANIYNFYLHPPSFDLIDAKYIIQSSSIKFLTEYKFDFNKCFSSGISFLNQTQENRLYEQEKSFMPNYQYSINEREFLKTVFEKINRWLITAHLGDTMEYEIIDQMLPDYFLQLEIRRCFKTIWSRIETTPEKKKILFIEHISKDTHEQRCQSKHENTEDFQSFIQSLVGFTQLIRYIRDYYRKVIVGHNCFLDWLLIYEKFLDHLPNKFEQFQNLVNDLSLFTLFDTKYLAREMKEYLFTRQHRSERSHYIDNLTTATSLSSLYDLVNSKSYENSVFFKPTIEIHTNDRYKSEVRKHEAGYDAYMSGVIFLKLIYLYAQKQKQTIDFHPDQSLFDLCLNDIQPFKNRFYSTFLPYISLNRYDRKEIPRKNDKKFHRCLVLQKYDQNKLDMSDIITRFSSYGAMDYQINGNLNQVFLLFQSNSSQRRILKDYSNHSVYQIETFHWWKHSFLRQYSLGLTIVMTGIGIFLLVKYRL